MAYYNKITTSTEMENYIKTELGYPVINVELHSDQLQQTIIDSIQDFTRYNYDEGSYRDYIILTITSGVDEYPLSAYGNVMNVFDFQLSFGADGINTLFSPTHELLYQDWVVKGNYPGGGSGPGLTITDYDISMMYLEEIKRHFNREYTVDYLPGRELLKIYPTPKSDATGMLSIYRKESAQYLYNNTLVKKLCVARAKKLWGLILGKYQMTLPGGGVMNASDIRAEGKEEEEKVLELIKLESPPPDFYVA